IDQPIRALPDVADALVQLAEHRLAPDFFPLVVEHQPLQLTGARNLAFAHPAYEDTPFPPRKPVAGIEQQAGRGDRGHPENRGLLEVGAGRSKARAEIVAAVAHDRPSIVLAGPKDVQFVAPVWSILVFPDLAGERVERQPELHAMPHREDR